MINKFLIKIKRQENQFYKSIYNFAKSIRNFNVPYIFLIHFPLSFIFKGLKNILIYIKRKFYDEPFFKSKCKKVGKNLRLPNGIPLIIGNLNIEIGDNVTIYRTTLGASHVYDNPTLQIGNNVTIGYGTTISVAQSVVLENNVLIAANCYITDNDEHPLDPIRRAKREAVSLTQIKPVKIESNVWIGYCSVILKGVNVGANSIISAQCVIKRSIPKNYIVLGSDNKSIKNIFIKR